MATDAAPDSAEPAVSNTHRKLSEELAHLQATFAEQPVQLREVIAVLRGRAYILLLILLSLPFSTPIPVPVSTPFGFVIALIALRLMLGQKPWLPKRLLEARLPAGFFGKLISITQRIVSVLEKLLRPRWLFLTATPFLGSLHAAVMFISGVVLLLPMVIPFTNAFPAWVILLIACGLLERDGLFVLAGYVVFAVGAVYFTFLGKGAQELFEMLKNTFAS
jgi:hypothetical protein